MKCNLCPRECGAERSVTRGRCGSGEEFEIAYIGLHKWEEPCISGENGSGTVFFTGCSLGCCYCQNREITRGEGRKLSAEELSDKMIWLESIGAHNINFVTAGHYADKLPRLTYMARKKGLTIPVVYNSGGYEKKETVKMLQGYVDVYLPDFKYASNEISALLSDAADYPEVAKECIGEMLRQQPEREYDENGLITRGVIIRHLVLPGLIRESRKVLDTILSCYGKDVAVSLMSQYFPPMSFEGRLFFLNRKLTAGESERIQNYLFSLGFTEGYVQSRKSAEKDYVPKWEV